MIVTSHQDMLATWLCNRIGLTPSPHIQCIGQVQDGKITGVVGFDGYNGASCVMHVAGEGNWCTKSLLFATFDYPFNRLNCNVVMAFVPSGNKAALRFNKHIGFSDPIEISGAHPDGSLLFMTMNKAQCRFLEARYGRQVSISSVS